MALVKIFIVTLLVCFVTFENIAGQNYNPVEVNKRKYHN